MIQDPNTNLVWIDLETTGLEPHLEARILEMAVVVTTANLDIEYTRNYLFDLPQDHSVMDDVVTEMHTKSGLLQACYTGPTWRWKEVTEEFLNDMEQFAQRRTIPFAGSSVQFDRAWLYQFAPDIEEWFHYRNADVSSLREFNDRWNPELATLAPKAQKIHRAMADIMDSIALARFYRNYCLSKNLKRTGW